ncbi:MAG: DGQHR domain-containing protein [Nitrococcus mobilis]|nr:DGQHR domain-containing protein [Nitrococcus mobilis]
MRTRALCPVVSGSEEGTLVVNGEDTLIVRALRTSQGRGIEVFAFFMPGEDIVRIADISRIHRDEKTSLQGFQRKEIRNHVNNIVEYLDAGDVLFPNAIILALSPEVEFKQTRGREPDGLNPIAHAGTLMIPLREEGTRVAWIVDGQQRSLALSKSKSTGLPVPVVAFIAGDLETQREQFILVNKAKPLPTRLINELLPEVDTHLPRDLAVRRLPSELCNILNRDPRSPFYERIRRASTDGHGTTDHFIVDTALIDVIRRSIGSPLGALAQFKGVGEGRTDTTAMYNTLLTYWSAVRDTFLEAWALPPSHSRLTHSAGIKAMGTLMDRIIVRTQGSDDQEREIRFALKRIEPKCCWISGVWEDLGMEWNQIQNVSKHVKALSEQLIKLDYEASKRERA